MTLRADPGARDGVNICGVYLPEIRNQHAGKTSASIGGATGR